MNTQRITTIYNELQRMSLLFSDVASADWRTAQPFHHLTGVDPIKLDVPRHKTLTGSEVIYRSAPFK